MGLNLLSAVCTTVSHLCLCRYKQHQTEYEEVPAERPLLLGCRVRGCRCSQYQYVPRMGSRPVRCRCKHLPQDHSEAGAHVCTKCSCPGFHSPSVCGCGQPSSAHQTLVETAEERQARGRPLGWDVPYAAMGGLTGFSSLMDGYLRLNSDAGQRRKNFKYLASSFQADQHFETEMSAVGRQSPQTQAEQCALLHLLHGR
uniref:Protein FAM221A n=1 Tax=Neogobius melanostomus TaxID=47308 RepID=A0A8C6S595_9GOBI